VPPPERANLVTPVILWPFVRYDGYGVPVYGSPVQLTARWDDGIRQVRRPDNSTVTAEGSAILPRAAEIESVLWKGCFADLPGTGEAGTTPADGGMRVIA